MVDPKEGGPGRQSFGATCAAIRDEAGNSKAGDAQLSDYSYFRSLGVERPPDHFKTACGLTRELAIAGQHFLNELGTVLIPLQGPEAQQPQTDQGEFR